MTVARSMVDLEEGPSSNLNLLEVGLETASFRRGGLNRYFTQLVRSLDQIGQPVRAITMGQEDAAGEEAAREVVVPARASIVRRLAAIRSAGRDAMSDTDIVDAHFALTALPFVTGLLRHRPLVVHFQGPWADESAATGQSVVVCGLKRLVERLVYRRAAAFVVLSQSFRRLLIERYGVSPWNIEVIHPGVDLDHFTPGDKEAARSRLGVPGDGPVVVTVRRLVPRMGLDVMVEAWAEVTSKLDGDAHWVVVGDGPSRASLEAQVARLHMEESIHFIGEVDEDLLVECYRAADLSVVPSVKLEGFGLSTLESLACGTPVVASDVGGLREAVGGLADSLLVPAGDARVLAERVEGALTGTIAVPGPGQCRSYAEQFSWEMVAQKHRALFCEVLARHRRKRATGAQQADRGAIRVVVVGHTAKLSGGELAISRLISTMVSVAVHVVLAEDGPLVSVLERAGATVEVLPMDRRARNLRKDRIRIGGVPFGAAWATITYTVRLARRLRQLKPDLVHTNTLKAALYGGVAARAAGVPCLWHVRDRIAEDYLPPFAVTLVRLAARFLPTEVIANSRTTFATLRLNQYRWKRVVYDGVTKMPPSPVVPSPVELMQLDSAKMHTPSNRIRVAMVGRLSPWKGQDVFLRAFAEAFAGGVEVAMLVGSAMFGEEEYEQQLIDLVEELGIGDRVEFCGFVHDVPKLLMETDVLVHASVIPEPFGQVVIEGMAAGLAVVACDAGGPAEVITHEIDGLLYPPGDVGVLAAHLRRLANDPTSRLRLANRAVHTAEKYELANVAAQCVEIYEWTISRQGRMSAEFTSA
jgi:glycosyltransferase involved in cell wall biosynthesis